MMSAALAVTLTVALWPDRATNSSGNVIERALAAAEAQQDVLHFATMTVSTYYEGAQHRPGRDNYKEVEAWIDSERGIVRSSSRERVDPGEVYRQEELTRDGVFTVLQSEQTQTGTVWTNVVEYDADLLLSERRGDPLLKPADVDFDIYKRLLRSGEATLMGSTETSGVPTYRLRLETQASHVGTDTLLVEVRRSDYLPVLVKGTEWYMQDGKRVLQREWTTEYRTVELLDRDQVPQGTLELQIPAGLSHSADYGITLSKAARIYQGVRAYWLGEAFNDAALESGRLRYMRRSGRGWPGGGHVVSIRQLIDMTRPQFSERSISAQYGGDETWKVKVISFPRIKRTDWEFPAWARMEDVTVGKRSGVLARFHISYSNGAASEEGDLLWLALDMGDATVVLQGWDVTADDLFEAAGQLRRVE
jgi:hypothetical protein